MHKLKFAAVAAALLASGAAATGYNKGRDWRAVLNANDQAIFFIDANSLKRAGSAVHFDHLVAYIKPTEDSAQYHYDREVVSILVDCSSRRYKLQDKRRWMGTEEMPPPLVFDPTEGPDGFPAPPSNSPKGELFKVACGDHPISPESIKDPFAWGREQFDN